MIIRNNIIPFKGYKIMNLCGILFVRKDATLSEVDLNHEKIHSRQCLELFVVGFYLLYVLEWVWHYFNSPSGKTAYRKISFEKEAYANEGDFWYLEKRKWWGMWRNKKG